MAIAGKNYDQLESLNELVEAIDTGLDIEFYLHGVRYNISTDGTPFIAVCPDGNGEYYQDGKDMVDNHIIDGKPLMKLWKEFQITGM